MPFFHCLISDEYSGTQRLPRLIGVQRAVEMMLISKPIQATEALELGLIDDIVPVSQLVQMAIERVKILASLGPTSWKRLS